MAMNWAESHNLVGMELVNVCANMDQIAYVGVGDSRQSAAHCFEESAGHKRMWVVSNLLEMLGKSATEFLSKPYAPGEHNSIDPH